MDIPASTTNHSSGVLRTTQELLTALQAQPQARATTASFDQSLESARALTDSLELGTPGQASTQDPTSSTLFQAHAGSMGPAQGLAAAADPALLMDRLAQLKVNGIEASAAPGPFTNGEPPPAGEVLPGLDSAERSSVPTKTGTGEFGNTYEALLELQSSLGGRLDLQI